MANQPSEVSRLAQTLKPIVMGWISSTVTGGSSAFPSYTINAGNGLTGGATLSPTNLSMTLHVVGDATLSVGADSMGVNLSNSFVWAAAHTFNAGIGVAAGFALTFGGDAAIERKAANVLAISSGDALQSTSFTSGVTGWGINADGSAEFSNVRIRGEFTAAVFRYNEVQATAGTFGVFKSASALFSAFTSPASVGGTGTLIAKNADGFASPLFANGDILRVRYWDGSAFRESWLTINGAPTNNGTNSSYPVQLSSGSTSITYPVGLAVVDYGPSGTGFITLSADGGVGSSANMTISKHSGSPWSSLTTLGRFGNLNGSYGIVANTYGIGVGDSAGNYMLYDGTTFKIVAGTSSMDISASGLRIVPSTSYFGSKAMSFVSDITTGSPTLYSDVYAIFNAFNNNLYVRTESVASRNSNTSIEANSPGGAYSATAALVATAVLPQAIVSAQVLSDVPRIDLSAPGGTIYATGDFNLSGRISLSTPSLVEAKNSANISLTSGTWAVVTMDTEPTGGDAYGFHSTTTNTSRFTVPTGFAGRYNIVAHMSFASNATGYRAVVIKVNADGNIASGTLIAADDKAAVNGDRTTFSISTEYNLAVGDRVEVFVFQNSGGPLNLEALSDYSPRVAMWRIA